MELTNEFVVGVGVDEAWKLLTDVERIAPCMPGAELQEIHGEEYRGVVKVKVGPITAQYKGQARFVHKDDGGYRAVLRAEGRDIRGQGNANATIIATLSPEGDRTRVSVVTNLAITGRAAQFGRGVLADVSAKILGQFVSCLESNVLGRVPPDAGNAVADTAEGTATGSMHLAAVGSGGPRAVRSQPVEPIDLLGAAGTPVVKRAVPALLGALLVFAGRWLLRRRRIRR